MEVTGSGRRVWPFCFSLVGLGVMVIVFWVLGSIGCNLVGGLGKCWVGSFGVGVVVVGVDCCVVMMYRI